MDKKTGLVYKQWDAPAPRAVLLLVHGLGAHTGRWEFLSRFLVQNSVSAYAIELKGFGKSQDLKGHIDSFEIYFDDIRTLSAIIKKEHPGAKVFILGESLGGLLAFLLAIKEPELFSGIICISPVFKSRLKFSLLDKIKIFVLMLFNPRKQFSVPFNSQMCTRDTSYQMVMDQDEREHRLASARLLINILIAQMRAVILKSKLTIPALFLIAGEDFLVDPKASAHIFKGLRINDKKIIQYPGMHHALSIDLGRERVFADILKWIQERMR